MYCCASQTALIESLKDTGQSIFLPALTKIIFPSVVFKNPLDAQK